MKRKSSDDLMNNQDNIGKGETHENRTFVTSKKMFLDYSRLNVSFRTL